MTFGPVKETSIDRLAVYRKIVRGTLCKLAQEAGLPGRKVRRRWWFHRKAVEEWPEKSRSLPRGRSGGGKQ